MFTRTQMPLLPAFMERVKAVVIAVFKASYSISEFDGDVLFFESVNSYTINIGSRQELCSKRDGARRTR